MLVPLSWLREFTPYAGTARILADRLTMLGLEVEDILNPFAAISGIKVGFVAQCELHPDSDHLHCCKVDMGCGETVDIVCGAPNVSQGQKVAVAPVGCSLPDGTVIKKSKLRGRPSCGMICSERELGLSEDHSGIMVLPEAAVAGHYLVDELNLDREVLDISVTPNRADCLSILGVARETAMAFSLPLTVPQIPPVFDEASPEIIVPVSIAEPDLCWLYSGRVISKIQVGPSPMRMRHRLLSVGLRSISNIVDVTNYILMECGQPLHSFDLDKLEGGRIIVRRAQEGERFTTLDGKERVLAASDLCICDARRTVGLAGVMGGQNSEVTGQTKNVFLESAVFRPQCVRGTSRRLGLSSEASYRFERGVDQRATVWALDRACALIAAMGGGSPGKGLSRQEPKPFMPARISFQPARADALLGTDLSCPFESQKLEALGCAVENLDGAVWSVTQPSWRPDITREADLIEEVGRIYGLDSIVPQLPSIHRDLDDSAASESPYFFRRRVRHWGAGLGLNEVVNYSFVGQADLDFLDLSAENRIPILNPLSEEQNVLRPCLAPGLLQDLSNNLAYGALGVRIFELANVFAADSQSETGARETGMLGILLYGQRHATQWPHKEADMGYADIKGIVANLLGFLRLGEARYSGWEKHPYLLPCARIYLGGEAIGHIGRVQPEKAQKFNAGKSVWLGELDLDLLCALHRKVKINFKPLQVYPASRRDITVIVGNKIKVDEILSEIFSLKLPFLEDAALIDCYEPENSQERNLTFRLTFRHGKRTLKDAEVDKEREKVAEFLKRRLGARI